MIKYDFGEVEVWPMTVNHNGPRPLKSTGRHGGILGLSDMGHGN